MLEIKLKKSYVMKKILFPIAAMALIIALGSTSCKKKESTPSEDPTPAPAPTNTTSTAPTAVTPAMASDADGVLVALKLNTATTFSVPYYGMMTTILKLDVGIAQFPATPGSTTSVDAGTVTLNTTALDKQTNNQYYKVQQVNQPDFALNTNVKWNVTGNGTVQAISNYFAPSLPVYDSTYFKTILPSNTITKTSGLTFNISGKLSGGSADSVICMVIGGGSTMVKKTVHRTMTSVTFSPTELGTLTNTTQGQFQITPYRVTSSLFGSKKYYFVVEQAYVATGVTVQ